VPRAFEEVFSSTADSAQWGEAAGFHVLVIPYSYPARHGPMNGIFIQDQVRALRKCRLRVGVIYPELRSLRTILKGTLLGTRFQTASFEEQGGPALRVHGWNLPGARVAGALWVHLARRLVQTYIDRFGVPDVCHAHNALWAGLAAREAKRQWRIPYVLTEHSSLWLSSGYVRGLISAKDHAPAREAFSEAAAVIAVSDALKQRLLPHSSGREIVVIPNMVDTDFFSLPACRRLEIPFRFLAIANLKPDKGIDLLLRAFAEAFGSNTSALLKIGGDGPERPSLERLSRKLGIEDRVRFLGALSRVQVRDEMWRATAFVHPSHVETFGIVLIEAMATGLPVIATRSGGPDTIVTRDVGHLIPKGAVSPLAEAMRDMFRFRSRFDEERIRSYAAGRFATEEVSRQLVTVLNAALRPQANNKH